jgi:hypothetical protein
MTRARLKPSRPLEALPISTRRLVQGVIGLLSLTAWTRTALAADRFVSPSGNDSWPGSIAQPWRTVAHAATTAIAGDTVYLRAGTYVERLAPAHSGSAGAPISFVAYQSEKAVIDGNGNTVLVRISGQSYITVSGLTLQNSQSATQPGVYISGGHHIVIRNNNVNHTGGPGIWADNILARDAYVQDDEDLVIEGNNLSETNVAGQNEALDVVTTHNFVVRNNTLGPTYKEGITCKDGASYGRVYGNTVPVGANSYNAVGIYIDAEQASTPIRGIEVFANVVDARNYGIAVAGEHGGAVEDVRIFNNVVRNTPYSGIVVASWSSTTQGQRRNISIVNNTVHACAVGIQVENDTVRENVVVRNNIASDCKSSQMSMPSDVIVDHNLIHGNSQVQGTAAVTGDPLFVNGASGNYHLQTTSPARDNGSADGAPTKDFDGTSRPQGSGIDIGAFEYSVGGTDAGDHPDAVSPGDGSIPVDDASSSKDARQDVGAAGDAGQRPDGTAQQDAPGADAPVQPSAPADATNDESSGCSCRLGVHRSSFGTASLLALLSLAFLRRKRNAFRSEPKRGRCRLLPPGR